MPCVINGRSPTFAVARGACSYQCLKQGQWSHRDNRTNCIHDPAAAHFCTCCVPCTAPLQRQRVVFFRAWPWAWPWPWPGRGRAVAVAMAVAGRVVGIAGWPAGRGRWSGVSLVAGCPHVRVSGWPWPWLVAGGRAVAGPWPGGRVAGWPGGWPGGRGLGGCLPSACIPSSLFFRAFRGIYPYTSVPIIHAGQEQSSKPVRQKKSK